MIPISPIKITFPKLTFLALLLFCKQSLALEGFCFPANVPLSSVKSYAQTILAPGDKVFERPSRNCLEFKISPNRTELLRKWISQKYKISKSYSEGVSRTLTAPTKKVIENCRLKVERVTKGNAKRTNVDVGRRNDLLQQSQSISGVRTSSILLGKGFSGKLRVNLETIHLTCLGKTGAGYQVSVSLDSPSSAISTVISVGHGSKVNIGQVVDNLNNKKKTLGISKGLSVENTKGSTTYDYFLLAQ